LPFRSALWGEKLTPKEQDERVDEVLEAVGLSSSASLLPRQLSEECSSAFRWPPGWCCVRAFFVWMSLFPLSIHKRGWTCKTWCEDLAPVSLSALFVTHDVTEALRVR